jgi:hypothetical protein
MSIIKLLLEIAPIGGGDKTPVFDRATGAFVTVTEGRELNFRGSVNLSAARVSRRASSAGFGEKVRPSIFKANR